MSAYEHLSKAIRDVPDFPKKGVLFKDITTLLADAACFAEVIDIFVERYKMSKLDKIIGIESRGFLFAPVLAYRLGAGMVPIRKPGKLPAQRVSITYELEYGEDTIEIHRDALLPGERVLLVDDLLATGGTAAAAVKLIKGLGAELVEAAFLVELEFLGGREKMQDVATYSILKY